MFSSRAQSKLLIALRAALQPPSRVDTLRCPVNLCERGREETSSHELGGQMSLPSTQRSADADFEQRLQESFISPEQKKLLEGITGWGDQEDDEEDMQVPQFDDYTPSQPAHTSNFTESQAGDDPLKSQLFQEASRSNPPDKVSNKDKRENQLLKHAGAEAAAGLKAGASGNEIGVCGSMDGSAGACVEGGGRTAVSQPHVSSFSAINGGGGKLVSSKPDGLSGESHGVSEVQGLQEAGISDGVEDSGVPGSDRQQPESQDLEPSFSGFMQEALASQPFFTQPPFGDNLMDSQTFDLQQDSEPQAAASCPGSEGPQSQLPMSQLPVDFCGGDSLFEAFKNGNCSNSFSEGDQAGMHQHGDLHTQLPLPEDPTAAHDAIQEAGESLENEGVNEAQPSSMEADKGESMEAPMETLAHVDVAVSRVMRIWSAEADDGDEESHKAAEGTKEEGTGKAKTFQDESEGVADEGRGREKTGLNDAGIQEPSDEDQASKSGRTGADVEGRREKGEGKEVGPVGRLKSSSEDKIATGRSEMLPKADEVSTSGKLNSVEGEAQFSSRGLPVSADPFTWDEPCFSESDEDSLEDLFQEPEVGSQDGPPPAGQAETGAPEAQMAHKGLIPVPRLHLDNEEDLDDVAHGLRPDFEGQKPKLSGEPQSPDKRVEADAEMLQPTGLEPASAGGRVESAGGKPELVREVLQSTGEEAKSAAKNDGGHEGIPDSRGSEPEAVASIELQHTRAQMTHDGFRVPQPRPPKDTRLRKTLEPEPGVHALAKQETCMEAETECQATGPGHVPPAVERMNGRLGGPRQVPSVPVLAGRTDVPRDLEVGARTEARNSTANEIARMAEGSERAAATKARAEKTEIKVSKPIQRTGHVAWDPLLQIPVLVRVDKGEKAPVSRSPKSKEKVIAGSGRISSEEQVQQGIMGNVQFQGRPESKLPRRETSKRKAQVSNSPEVKRSRLPPARQHIDEQELDLWDIAIMVGAVKTVGK